MMDAYEFNFEDRTLSVLAKDEPVYIDSRILLIDGVVFRFDGELSRADFDVWNIVKDNQDQEQS